MELKKITCDGCGAALSITGEPNFIDCRFCGASLRVVRNETATFTEVRKQIDALGGEVARLHKEARLRAIDDDWAKLQEQLTNGKRLGSSALSMRRTGTFVAVLCMSMGIFVIMLPGGRDAAYKLGFGVFMLLLGLVCAALMRRRAGQFALAEQAYLQQRTAVEHGDLAGPKPAEGVSIPPG